MKKRIWRTQKALMWLEGVRIQIQRNPNLTTVENDHKKRYWGGRKEKKTTS